MSRLLDLPPYGHRDDARFMEEINALTRHHLDGCSEYRRIFPAWSHAAAVEEIPFVHVGAFKYVAFKTSFDGAVHQRTLLSSATTSANSSRIALDARSSNLQSRSVVAIMTDFIGPSRRPLLLLDSALALRRRGQITAALAAGLGLQPFATRVSFLLKEPYRPDTLDWDALEQSLRDGNELIIYGLTWVMWLALGEALPPPSIRDALAHKRIHFVHSGGWKKLEGAGVDMNRFDTALLSGAGAGSRVIDYYGLVEQVGIVYPLCDHGFRHVPVWADVLVRDTYTLEVLESEPGQLQLLNVLAFGAPYHSVLTEDRGTLVPGPCPCGRRGKRFRLAGRLPRAEIRGCANV